MALKFVQNIDCQVDRLPSFFKVDKQRTQRPAVRLCYPKDDLCSCGECGVPVGITCRVIQLATVLVSQELLDLKLAALGKQLGVVLGCKILKLINDKAETRPLMLRYVGKRERRGINK